VFHVFRDATHHEADFKDNSGGETGERGVRCVHSSHGTGDVGCGRHDGSIVSDGATGFGVGDTEWTTLGHNTCGEE